MSRRCRSDDGPARAQPEGSNRHALETAADVRRLLAAQIMQLTANPDLDPLQKAGHLAQLARVVLRAIELDSLEARMEAVATVLRLQKDDQARKETSP